jgi:hypothetical protein
MEGHKYEVPSSALNNLYCTNGDQKQDLRSVQMHRTHDQNRHPNSNLRLREDRPVCTRKDSKYTILVHRGKHLVHGFISFEIRSS